MEPSTKIKVGISSCLLGNEVRYNGGHTRDPYIVGTLSKYMEFVPVCPEVECGLSIPREAMRLVGSPEAPRLVTIKTQIDHTERMTRWAEQRLLQLETEQLCGFIFMSKSPSSGMERVKVYSEKNIPTKVGVGLFAKAFMQRFPLIPVEEDGRLHDPILRESFIERLFVLKRWRALNGQHFSSAKIIEFHTRHKLQLLAHSPKHYQEMGRLIATISKTNFESQVTLYGELLTTALKLRATPKKHVNVMQHIMGYFKKELSADEKSELIEIIEHYKTGSVPLIVPITLLKHYVRKYDQKYLTGQFYLEPHPLELKLRNHV